MAAGDRTEPAEERAAVSRRALPPEFASLLIVGRWVVIGTVVLALVLRHPYLLDRPALVAVGLAAALYNLSQWLLLRGERLDRYPPAALIAGDLLLVTALVWVGGGIRGPFEGLYYLVIIAAAAFGDTRGSALTAVVVSGLEFLIVMTRTSEYSDAERLAHLLNTIPFFFLTAAMAGSLVRYLRHEWERRHAAEDRLAAVDRELAIAREVQASFVGQAPPSVPGLDIAAHSEPFYGVGGDLQDYVPLADGVGGVLADISGHGLGAAMLAARLSQALEGIGLGMPLQRVAALWNQAVLRSTSEEVFVTAVFFQAETGTGRIRYLVAGHPPPLHWSCRRARVAPLKGHGMALGALDDARFGVDEVLLDIGDVLLLYTDGAVEARDVRGEMLEQEGLAALLERRHALPPQQLVERLAEDIRAGRQIRDDITLVALARRRDAPAPAGR